MQTGLTPAMNSLGGGRGKESNFPAKKLRITTATTSVSGKYVTITHEITDLLQTDWILESSCSCNIGAFKISECEAKIRCRFEALVKNYL